MTRRIAGICGARSSAISARLNLVLVVHRMAKRLAGKIEGAEQIVGLLLLQQIKQIAGKAEDRPDRFAPRTGHFRQGVKHLMDQRVGVDHPDRLAVKSLRWCAPLAVGVVQGSAAARLGGGASEPKPGSEVCRLRSFIAILALLTCVPPGAKRCIVRDGHRQRNGHPPQWPASRFVDTRLRAR